MSCPHWRSAPSRPSRGSWTGRPRDPSEQLFSRAVVRRFLFLGSIQSAGVVFAFFWRIHSAHIPFSEFTSSNPVYREAITMTQAGIVMSQFFNGFAVRTEEQSIFKVGLLSNRPLVAAEFLGVGIMACISYLPPLQHVFNTTGLTVYDWLMLTAFGVVLLVAEELRKAVHRARRRAHARAAPLSSRGPGPSRSPGEPSPRPAGPSGPPASPAAVLSPGRPAKEA